MTKSFTLLLPLLSLMALAQPVFAQENAKPGQPLPEKSTATVAPPVQETSITPMEKMSFKEVAPGVRKAALWGDLTKGGYGALTKFKANAQHPSHVHTDSISIIVVSGTFLYGEEGAAQKKLGPGSYIRIAPGRPHTSGSEGECVFFETSASKFEMIPTEVYHKREIDQPQGGPAAPPPAPSGAAPTPPAGKPAPKK